MSYVYRTEQEAARGMLGEASTILRQGQVKHAVMGGWVPYLFNSTPIPHPGTFDVDILIDDRLTRSEMEHAAKAFLRAGYMPGAKNMFQLYRVLQVGDQPMVFHVDFLHRRYAQPDEITIDWGVMQSIAGPGTDLVFEENEWTMENVDLTLPDGMEQRVSVPFGTEIALLSTKARSMGIDKRRRDAFDAFLVIGQSRDRAHLVSRTIELFPKSGVFRASMMVLFDQLRRGERQSRICEYVTNATDGAIDDPTSLVAETIEMFFKESQLTERFAYLHAAETDGVSAPGIATDGAEVEASEKPSAY